MSAEHSLRSIPDSLLRIGIAVAAFGLSVAAFGAAAATTTKPAAADEELQEVVVTGTSLRGVAPAGAVPITLDAKQIAATGALSTDQLLAKIPQLSSFNALPTVNSGGTQLTVNRTNIRNLPQGVGGGSPTLVLVDGHRVVGMGVKQSYPDPDIVPPALIERVDVLTDGGSAIYGSDAVGGVINFVTRKNYDGLDLGVRQGLGNSYRSTDINFTAGKFWDTGSAYVGYNYSQHSSIYGSARSYVRNINYTTGLPTGQSCSPANVVVGSATYAVVGGNSLSLSNANLCDPSKTSTFLPQELRSSVMAGFRQQLGDNLELEIKGYYSERDDKGDNGPLGGSAAVTSVNPRYIPFSVGSTASQTVFFNFAPLGAHELVTTNLKTSGITPTLTWKIGHDWQMKAYYNFGQSKTVANDPLFDSASLNSAVANGTINPYNIATSNAAALQQVLNFTQYGIGQDQLNNFKATFDGPLFKLPGGDLRVAVGAEYSHEQFDGIVTSPTSNQAAAITPLNPASRNVKSEFVEFNLPLIGPANDIPFIHSLDLAVAERHDAYSDFGGNWAPSVGATLKPVSWIGLRARWNKSFQAPSLVQISQATSPSVQAFPGNFTTFVPGLINPADPWVSGVNGPIVAIQGTLSPLQPQLAKDYNLGFDISPPFVEGLDFHVTYFNINYAGQISTPPLGFGVFWGVPTFANLVLPEPTTAALQSFLASHGASAAAITQVLAQVAGQLGSNGTAYYVADVRARNLGISKVHGMDYAVNYHHDVPFGTVFGSINSSFTAVAINAADGVNYGINQAGIDGAHFSAATVIGATVGENFRGQLTWNHTGGFTLSAPAQLGQKTVASFDTIDLYAQYDLSLDHANSTPLTLSLGISNALNTNPPRYNGSSSSFGSGYAGSTLGRVFQLGANVKF